MTMPDADYPTTHADLTRRARRDVVALALLVLGMTGLLLIAWVTDPLTGGAVLSLYVIAAGVWLGLDR